MDIRGKKVLVFGSGISGEGSCRLLLEKGAEVVLYDGNEKLCADEIEAKILETKKENGQFSIVLGTFPEEIIEELSFVVMSPGVPTDLPIVEKMREKEHPDLGRDRTCICVWKRRRSCNYRNKRENDDDSPFGTDHAGL